MTHGVVLDYRKVRLVASITLRDDGDGAEAHRLFNDVGRQLWRSDLLYLHLAPDLREKRREGGEDEGGVA